MQNKIKIWKIGFISLILTGLLASTALAGKFTFNSLDFNLGGSLVLQGSLVGLGNQVAQVTLTGYGSVWAMCENKGGQQAPGRNPVYVEVQQSGLYVSEDNGRALVRVVAPDPTEPEFAPSPTPKQAGCPNGNWAVVGIVDNSTDWTAARVMVKDEFGQIQIDQFFTCTTTFENGIATSITCVEA
jgi:hypothetical protein